MSQLLRIVASMAVASLFTVTSIVGQGDSRDSLNPPGWTLLRLGEKKDGFIFTNSGTVDYKGKSLGSCHYNPKFPRFSEASISPASPQRGLRLVVCWEDGQGGVDARVVSSKTSEIITKSIIPSGWGIAKWVSWAPNEQYALVFAVGEVTMGDMAIVNLSSGSSQEVHFKKLVTSDKELQVFNPETVKWLSPVAFRLRLDVHCNPYELGDAKCNYERVLRSNNVKVAVNPLMIDYSGGLTVADNIITALLFGWPILLGLTIWLAKPKAAIDVLSRCDRAVLSFKERADRSTGYFAKYWRRPVSRALLLPARGVDRIGEPFLRSGIKATLYPYTIACIAIGTFIEAELLLLLGCFIAIFAIWGLFDRLNGAQSAFGGREIRRSKVAERQCPDCNSVKVNPFLNEGDGKCSVCHGTGEGGLLDHLADVTNLLGRQGTECFKCHGTGQCQTCGGNGVVYA